MMALHVSEMGVQIKVGGQEAQASGDACDPDDGDEAKQSQQDQVVAETVRRVLEILKFKGER
jgi:hypothetical protein